MVIFCLFKSQDFSLNETFNTMTQEDPPINENLIQRVVAVIEQASSIGESKQQIVTFLKDQNALTENDIYIAYTRYYEKNVCGLEFKMVVDR